MTKGERISTFAEQFAADGALHPCYIGFFACFNEQRYYEAHDVLEHLWLEKPEERFFKGLIQVAGAFVHLQKQFLRPAHPKDGLRLRPAARLFHLAMANLAGYLPRHMSLDVEALHRLCAQRAGEIIASDFRVNPWRPDDAPALFLDR